MQRVLSMARRAAPVELPVLIAGESGVGKTALARYIHEGRATERMGRSSSSTARAFPLPWILGLERRTVYRKVAELGLDDDTE